MVTASRGGVNCLPHTPHKLGRKECHVDSIKAMSLALPSCESKLPSLLLAPDYLAQDPEFPNPKSQSEPKFHSGI